jgi:hypothetical protein
MLDATQIERVPPQGLYHGAISSFESEAMICAKVARHFDVAWIWCVVPNADSSSDMSIELLYCAATGQGEAGPWLRAGVQLYRVIAVSAL